MINNEVYTKSSWTFQKPQNIILTWKELPFCTKTSVKWRGQLIHIRIKANKTVYGWTRLITFLYRDKLYPCGLTKWKWSGGGNGINPPKISTSTHKLKIDTGADFLSLKEELIGSGGNLNISGNPFEIFETPEDIVFELPEPVVSRKKEIKIEKNEVTLYKYSDHNININSYAYFLEGNLVVDYWKLGVSYEDEYFTEVKSENLQKLYSEFQIENENKAELLIGLLNAFNGEKCYDNIKEFFEQKEIPFQNSVRRDCI